MADPSDEDLLARVAVGDGDAMERHLSAIGGYCPRMTPSHRSRPPPAGLVAAFCCLARPDGALVFAADHWITPRQWEVLR